MPTAISGERVWRAGTCRGGPLPAPRARAAGRRGCWSWASGACPRHAAGSGSDAWGLVARGGAGARPRRACSGWREAWVYGRLESAGRAASGWRAGRGRVAEGRCRPRQLELPAAAAAGAAGPGHLPDTVRGGALAASSRERVGPPTAGSSARGEGAETAARQGPAVGAMSGPATGGGRVVEGQPAAGAALRARGAAETAAAAAGGRPRPHRAGGATGGVGARGPGGQRRGRRSATTPPRGRGNQAVAGASAVPRVLARSTAEPSRTLADSGDCISGTARNRRPTPSYSASIVGS